MRVSVCVYVRARVGRGQEIVSKVKWTIGRDTQMQTQRKNIVNSLLINKWLISISIPFEEKLSLSVLFLYSFISLVYFLIGETVKISVCLVGCEFECLSVCVFFFLFDVTHNCAAQSFVDGTRVLIEAAAQC